MYDNTSTTRAGCIKYVSISNFCSLAQIRTVQACWLFAQVHIDYILFAKLCLQKEFVFFVWLRVPQLTHVANYGPKRASPFPLTTFHKSLGSEYTYFWSFVDGILSHPCLMYDISGSTSQGLCCPIFRFITRHTFSIRWDLVCEQASLVPVVTHTGCDMQFISDELAPRVFLVVNVWLELCMVRF